MQIQNNYPKIDFQGAVKFKRASFFDSKKLCSFEVPHERLGLLKVTTEKKQKGKYITRIEQNGYPLGRESFCIDNGEIYGIDIKINERYRGQNLGEITRLASIITMVKNGLNKISLYSLEKAIVFHSKYKFTPEIKDVNYASLILEHIIGTKSGEFAQNAQDIINKYQKTENQKELLACANKLVAEVINDARINKKTNSPCSFWNIDMNLTLEDVLKNKDFFNALFKKHDIDYKI